MKKGVSIGRRVTRSFEETRPVRTGSAFKPGFLDFLTWMINSDQQIIG